MKDEVSIVSLREKSDAELLAEHVQLRKVIFENRSLVTTNESKSHSNKVRAAKKQIARMLTILRERQLEQS